MGARNEPGFPQIPGYILESVLGRGSMATVYRARQEGMDRPVAVKVLEEAVLANKKIIGRLMREARIAARFNHPHIVRALDAGVHESSCYFVMELVEGQSIRDLVERQGPLAEDTALELAIEITEALFQLHSEHIIHRDVKPANVMVDRDGNAMLADFGLAKIEFDSSMTSQNHSVGTPAYMSPEQAKNPDGVDARTDLFSLGATLYHMVTGISPFEGPSVGAVITKILYEDPVPLSDLNPKLSAEFCAIISKLLSKERDDRYLTSGELLRDLRSIKRGAEPRVLRAQGKRRAGTGAALRWGGAAALVLIVGAAFLWSGDDNKQEETETDHKNVTGTTAAAKKTGAAKDIEEARVESAITQAFGDIRSKIRTGRFKAARSSLDSSAQNDFARILGLPFDDLPKWVRIQFENEKLKVEQALATKAKADADASRQGALAFFRSAAAKYADATPYLSKADFLGVLEALPEEQTRRFSGEVIARAREDAVLEVMKSWREEFDSTIEALRNRVSANDFAGVSDSLAALRRREPGRLGEGYITRLKDVEERLGQRKGELQRQTGNLLATVSMLPPQGSPEIRQRDFTPLLSRFATFAEALGDLPETASVEMQTFAVVHRVLRDSRAWQESALTQLEAGRLPAGLALSLQSGKSFPRFVVDEVADQVVTLRLPDAAGVVTFHIRELSIETLQALNSTDPDQANRVRGWFSYCDGDLLSAESTLGDLAEGDLFRRFMAPRLEDAWVELVKVETTEGKAAFRSWRQAMTAYRQSKWDEALSRIREITADKELKKSPWYKSNRKSIREIEAECRERSDIESTVAATHGRVDVLSLSPSRVAFRWDFSKKEQARDFALPPEMTWSQGALVRTALDSKTRMTPVEIEPLTLRIPSRLKSVPFEMEIGYRTSPRVEEAPRFLILSCFGHHVAVLSRLKTSPMKHLALHGLEKSLLDSLEFGQVVAWSGKLADYRKAFAGGASNPELVFESNKHYALNLKLDPEAGTLSLSVNGKKIIQRDVALKENQDATVDMRIPMPHRIEKIQVRCGLHISRH